MRVDLGAAHASFAEGRKIHIVILYFYHDFAA